MTLDVAIVGCGHMGALHARTVARHPDCRLVAFVDVVPERARALAAAYGGEARIDVPDGADAVIVATPTTTHRGVAEPLMDRWLLVEKPLADTSAAAAALVGPRVAVGHVERFNPAVVAVGDPAPRLLVARRRSPRTGRGADTDVVLDLVVHDLDLATRWGGDVVDLAAAAPPAPDHRDVAAVRLRTERGLRAWLYASRVSERRERTVRLVADSGWYSLDLVAGTASRGDRPLPRPAADGLTAQWDRFVAWTRGASEAPATAREGAATVRLAERVVAALSASPGRVHPGSSPLISGGVRPL